MDPRTHQVRIYSVPAISCGHCQSAIEAAVGMVPGVESVHVDIAARTVRVEGAAPDTTIRSAIDDAGYDVAGDAKDD